RRARHEAEEDRDPSHTMPAFPKRLFHLRCHFSAAIQTDTLDLKPSKALWFWPNLYGWAAFPPGSVVMKIWLFGTSSGLTRLRICAHAPATSAPLSLRPLMSTAACAMALLPPWHCRHCWSCGCAFVPN